MIKIDSVDENLLLSLYPEYNKILGPYKRSDGRNILVLVKNGSNTNENHRTLTLTYARALIECKLNRKLDKNEVVHHLDENKLHDSLDNLAVMARNSHGKQHFDKFIPYKKKCQVCGKEFTVDRKHHNNHMKGDAWCCSKSCCGHLGAPKRKY